MVVGANLDALCPLDQLVDRRHREAAFLDIGHADRFDDFRVDEHDERIAALGNVDHDDLLVHVDLGRGQPDSGRGVHGFGHVGDQLFQAFVEDGDRGSHFMQPGVGVAEYVQNHLWGNFACKLNRLYGESNAIYKLFGLGCY